MTSPVPVSGGSSLEPERLSLPEMWGPGSGSDSGDGDGSFRAVIS